MIRAVEGTPGTHQIANPPAVPAAERPGGAGATFRAVLAETAANEKAVDRLIDQALHERISDPNDLLRLQVTVHRFQHQVEITSRIAEQLTQAVRTLLRP
jgi:hypothetical protein